MTESKSVSWTVQVRNLLNHSPFYIGTHLDIDSDGFLEGLS